MSHESTVNPDETQHITRTSHTRHTHTHTYTHAQLTTQLLTHYAERGQYLGQWVGWQRHALCAGCILHSAQPHTGVFIQGESCLYNLHLTCIKLTIHKRVLLFTPSGWPLPPASLVGHVPALMSNLWNRCCSVLCPRGYMFYDFKEKPHSHCFPNPLPNLYRITCKCGGGLPCYCCSMGFLA